jgi:hypothetical protein
MTVDELVGQALQDLAGQARPQPEPYGRVRLRYQQQRRRRQTTWAAGMVVVLLAVWALGTPCAEPAPPPASGFDAVRMWAQRLADSPVRGQVAAADPGYVQAVAAQVTQHRQDGVYLTQYRVRAVKVLFVDDVGPWRVAFVALPLIGPSATGWQNASAYFMAPRGADASTLTKAESLRGYSDGLEPVEQGQFDGGTAGTETALVALAPDGCAFSSAAWPELTDWQPEPTGSYLVRTKATLRSEWWRVECGGRIRAEMPAPYDAGNLAITDDVVTQQLGLARGTPTRELARRALTNERGAYGNNLSGLPRLVWGGRVTWPAGSESTLPGITTVTAAPLLKGGWSGSVSLDLDAVTGGQLGASVPFWVDFDPTAPGSTLALRLGQEASGVLVIAPQKAVKVRAERAGSILAEASVVNDAAVLVVPDPMTATFEALDAAGKVIGSTVTGRTPTIIGEDGWSVP